MVNSGITLNEGVLDQFNDMKTKNTLQLLVMHIVGAKVHVHETESKETCTNDELQTFFQSHENDPFYVIHDFVTDQGYKKLIFVKWVPDTAPSLKKMKYASTYESLKPEFQGVTKFIEANDLTDITESEILATFNR